MKSQLRIYYLCGILMVLWSIAIIPFTLAEQQADKTERDKAVSTLDELYLQYLRGNTVEARTNLLKAVALMQQKSTRMPEIQTALIICYARLSLLERKAGNEAQSRIYFEKSRYWRIIEREKLGIKPNEIIRDHDAFTREDSDKYALEWDKKYTKGVGPAYLQELK